MELIQLRSFHQIVRTGSFSKASRNIFRSQSALSHQIKRLEEELNVKLFERLGKRIRVTEQGRILFDTVDKFLYDLGELRKRYIDIKNSKAGSLTIASSSAIMTYILPDTIKRFINKYPGINLRLIVCSFVSEIESLILEGNIDFGLGIKLNQILPKKISYLNWRSFDTFLITPKYHPLAYKKTITLLDIASYPHIIYRKGSVLRNVVEEVYARNNIKYRIIMEVDVAENIKGYVEMGLGVGIISSATLIPKDKRRFYVLNVSSLFGEVEIGIYSRKGQYISSMTKQFIKLFAPELLRSVTSPE